MPVPGVEILSVIFLEFCAVINRMSDPPKDMENANQETSYKAPLKSVMNNLYVQMNRESEGKCHFSFSRLSLFRSFGGKAGDKFR